MKHFNREKEYLDPAQLNGIITCILYRGKIHNNLKKTGDQLHHLSPFIIFSLA